MVLLKVVDIEQVCLLEDNEQEQMEELDEEEKKQWQVKLNKIYKYNLIPSWEL